MTISLGRVAVTAWYFGGGAFLLSNVLAAVGLVLFIPAATYGVWRAAFTPRVQRALAWGGMLLLEAVLNVWLWAIATDHDSATHGVSWGLLAALGALMIAGPPAVAVWSRRRLANARL
jgi:hypothetical protein